MAISDYRFENLPRSAQISIFTVIVFCLAFVFYFYYLKDIIKEQKKVQAEVVKLEKSVAQGTAIENQLKRFKQELSQLEQRLAVLQSILPAQKETPSVLRSVQQMAASSSLKINRFTPQPVVPRAFHSDWPIQIEVEGNYDGLGSFFEKVSRATRIIDVGSISISGSNAQATDPSRTLTASCTATTFVFREDQVVSPQVDDRKKEKKR
ncbi:MAG: type 4a pilus biogenesis protein PilO [Acidobacteria bacterium]|nr:type 4a pilus biogenesis protein PilO [Acidobacteriota bacterium]